MTLRKDTADALAAALAARPDTSKWRVRPNGTPPGNASAPFIVIRQKSITRTPGAPRLYWDVGLLFTVAVPEMDPERVEDLLEEAVETFLEVLEGLEYPGLVWSGAERVMLSEWHAYDVETTITTVQADT